MPNIQKLSNAMIKRKLGKLKGWRFKDRAITKEFVLDSFTAAVRFIGKIAPVANKMDHHPDVQIYKYKRVKIILTTHDAKGITQDDFDLAEKIETLRL